jgi:hypothetical protein
MLASFVRSFPHHAVVPCRIAYPFGQVTVVFGWPINPIPLAGNPAFRLRPLYFPQGNPISARRPFVALCADFAYQTALAFS